MKFGVIVCSKCKKVKGVDLVSKTTKCHRCGKILTINKLKIFYKTNSQEELTKVIGVMNLKLNGKLDEFEEILQDNS